MTDYIEPDKERFAIFKGLDREGPIHMLNLVRLKDEAIYEDGSQTTSAGNLNPKPPLKYLPRYSNNHKNSAGSPAPYG